MPYADPEANRQRSRERRRAATKAGQDISKKLGTCKNPRRRKKAEKSYEYFAGAYFPERFTDPWSDDHRRAIEIIEEAVLRGGKLIIIMPRGTGKTTLVVVAVIWALLYGFRNFVVIVGSDKGAAVELLESIKAELLTNERLAEDFPLEVGPFVLLEGESRRCTGQRYKDKRTYVTWKGDSIVFASVPKSKAAGSVVRVAGITGRIRGMQHTRPDGKVARPDLVVPDDPQTDDSANSASQTHSREKVLTKSIRGLAGPGKTISILMPATVIVKDDLADRMADKRRHPEWDAIRMKALYSFPTNMQLWDEYARIYRDSRERGGDGHEAREFYASRRAEMDAGAKPAWDARFERPAEISAVQSCMNLFLFNRAVFFSEHQNEPEDEVFCTGRITPEVLVGKLNGRRRGEIPRECRWIVGHVDVHDEILYWEAVAIEPSCTCYTIDYGTWPGQPARYFAQSNPPLALSKVYPQRDKDAVIFAALQELFRKELLPRRYPREGGGDAAVDFLAVDVGYKPELIGNVIRSLAAGNRILPTKGIGFGPAKKPFTEYRAEPGVILGRHWRKAVTKAVGMLTLEIDTNRWKSFTRDRIVAPMATSGSWSIFGAQPAEHQLQFDHLGAEIPTQVEGPWGKMEQWAPPPSKPDQHWWDNIVDALCVACSIPGGPKLAEWNRHKTGSPEKAKPKRQAVHYL